MENLSIQTNDVYGETYKQFLQSSLSVRLRDKFTVKPFYLRYRMLRFLALVSSFGVHFFSAATAFTCVFVFLNPMLRNAVVAGCFAVVSLFVLEALKRLTIPDFCKNILQFGRIDWFKGMALCILIGFSVMLSYSGAQDSVKLLTPSVILTNVDSVRNEYKTRIATLETRLSDVDKTQSWRGALTMAGEQTYKSITEQISLIESDMLINTNKLTDKNEHIAAQYAAKTSVNAHYFGILTLVLDCSLVGLLFFLEYYDYRSFAEFALFNQDASEPNGQQKQSSDEPQNEEEDLATLKLIDNVATGSNGLDESILRLAIKSAKSNLSAYEAKRRNSDGNDETNQKGIERWQLKLRELEAMLPNLTTE